MAKQFPKKPKNKPRLDHRSPFNYPHISRNYSRIGIGAIFIVLIVISQLISKEYDPNDAYMRQIMWVLESPGVTAYQSLGLYFEKKLDFTNAKYFYQIALGQGSGQAQKDLTRITAKEHLPGDMRSSLASWRQFVTDHPNYTDGWLQVAAYQWQLGQKNESKLSLEQVLTIDPENQTAKQFLTAF